MKEAGTLVGNFELNWSPRGDQSGRGPSFFSPLKDTIFKRRQMNRIDIIKRIKKIYIKYILLYFFACNPKRDPHG